MANYRKDVATNRDALFGGVGGGAGGAPRAKPTSSSVVRSRPTPPPPQTTTTATTVTITPGPSVIFASHGRGPSSSSSSSSLAILTGQAKINKMAEAEDYRLRAKKAMTRGVFSRPDPISAANCYARAAECYKACGENRLERLHRVASGDCQRGQGAYATAASEYTRAAELAESSDEGVDRRRKECRRLHADASSVWEEMGEKGRAAESSMKAAFGSIVGTRVDERMDDDALACVESAIEMFVGDPLNSKRDYRRTGTSRYVDIDVVKRGGEEAGRRAAMELASQNVVTDSYAHEILIKAGNELLRRRMYESALYAYGASTAILKHEGYATVSLYRSYLSESIITLAMGDAVAASRDYESVHLQDTGYLSSRECALEEDLVRACANMDGEALDEARGRTGPNRGALANLDPTVRELAGEIRVSGRAGRGGKGKGKGKTARDDDKDGKGSTPSPSAASSVIARATASPPAAPASGKVVVKSASPTSRQRDGLDGAELERDTDAGFEEMDDIMNRMGLDDDDDNDDGDNSDDDVGGDGDDDEIDLT